VDRSPSAPRKARHRTRAPFSPRVEASASQLRKDVGENRPDHRPVVGRENLEVRVKLRSRARSLQVENSRRSRKNTSARSSVRSHAWRDTRSKPLRTASRYPRANRRAAHSEDQDRQRCTVQGDLVGLRRRLATQPIELPLELLREPSRLPPVKASVLSKKRRDLHLERCGRNGNSFQCPRIALFRDGSAGCPSRRDSCARRLLQQLVLALAKQLLIDGIGVSEDFCRSFPERMKLTLGELSR